MYSSDRWLPQCLFAGRPDLRKKMNETEVELISNISVGSEKIFDEPTTDSEARFMIRVPSAEDVPPVSILCLMIFSRGEALS